MKADVQQSTDIICSTHYSPNTRQQVSCTCPSYQLLYNTQKSVIFTPCFNGETRQSIILLWKLCNTLQSHLIATLLGKMLKLCEILPINLHIKIRKHTTASMSTQTQSIWYFVHYLWSSAYVYTLIQFTTDPYSSQSCSIKFNCKARQDPQEETFWIVATGFSTEKMMSCPNSATGLKANSIIII